jgi:hypothetical protein
LEAEGIALESAEERAPTEFGPPDEAAARFNAVRLAAAVRPSL